MDNYQIHDSHLQYNFDRRGHSITSKKEYFALWAYYTGTEESDEADNEYLGNNFKNNKFLRDYLSFQLHTSILNKNEMLIGEYIIDNIDKNGYLTVNLNEISDLFSTPEEEIEKILYIIHTFDPPGIGARNLKECLLIQLSQSEISDQDVIKAVSEHLDDFAFRITDDISKVMEIDSKRVCEIKKIIKGLEPKPGRAFYNDEIKYVIPDVFVKKLGGKIMPVINKDSLPILVTNSYSDRSKLYKKGTPIIHYINEYEEKLLWLSKCIEQRKSILLKISRYIIDSSKMFFEHGKKPFNRIPIQSAQKDLEISSSIIKRIAHNKYIKCRWGIYEIKNFFSPL